MNRKEKEKYVGKFNFVNCEQICKYDKVAKIGQGTFGEVFKARHVKNKNMFVAMKRIITDTETEGFPITALREIRILQLLKNENIVKLLEVCRSKPTPQNKFRSTFYLIFEFCEHDLAGLLSNPEVKFNNAEIKSVMQQLLNGLFYIHTNKLLHRDLKTANVLMTKSGVLKLADFGLARAISINANKKNNFTNRVVTLWYRPPELLLGDRNYGPAIDMWGAGCIMAEMWTKSPILQGSTEQMQLNMISQLCGSITPQVWHGVELLHLYNKMELLQNQKRKVIDRLKPYIRDPKACDLVDKLLTLDPEHRINADGALNHDFFWTDPMPADLGEMLSQHHESMFELHAPQRRMRQHQAHAHHQHHQQQLHQHHAGHAKPGPSKDDEYADRVY